MNAITLAFQNTQFDIVDRNGQPWLRVQQIAVALGYSRTDILQQLHARNSEEFTDSMTALVKLPTACGEQETRIFSLRGAHLLGMMSRTEKAAEFRHWVLDVLEKTSQRPETVSCLPATPADLEQHLKHMLQRSRFLLTVSDDGGLHLKPVPFDAYVVTEEKLAALIAQPGEVSRKLMPAIINAAAQRLAA